MALHHHEAGNLTRARALYEQVLALDPRHADGLQFLGILCHQSGDSERAEQLIREAIAVKPQVSPYYDNLGSVLESAGRLEEALAAFERADELEPGDPDRDYNIGVVLEGLGRAQPAEARYRRALERRPEDPECRFRLANLLKARGAADQAEIAYQHVLRVAPEHVGARINLGNLLQDSGRLDEAERLYRDAIAADPNNARAHHNLGNLLRLAQREEQALASFERALTISPDMIEPALARAGLLEARGRADLALAGYRSLYRAVPSNDDALAGLARTLRVRLPPDRGLDLERALLDAVSRGLAPVAALLRPIGALLCEKLGLTGTEPAAGDRVERAAHDALLALLLERGVVVTPALERWLTRLRRDLLLHPERAPAAAPLLPALALQCCNNDYAFVLGRDEHDALAALGAELEAWLTDRAAAPAEVEDALLRYACYRPLAQLAGADALTGDRAAHCSERLRPVLERTLLERREEQRLASTLPLLAPVDDTASSRVRAQYEEHPYPRWLELPGARGADPLRAPWAGTGPPQRAVDGEPRALDVLVAGCGTGQEALAIAARWPQYRVTGLDLSASSLAYARRMGAALALERVAFVHGDLLDVGRLGRQFDLITASGVLHHLADPLAGWRALLEVLRADGTMKIGLYSAAARAPVRAARARIDALGLEASADGVRALRARVLAGDEPELAALLESEDFYTTASCRDLLFHPIEHRLTLPELARMLETLELRFLGFELAHPLVARRFAERFPGRDTDLDAWAEFERDHPETFEAMYVFWCARVDARRERDDA